MVAEVKNDHQRYSMIIVTKKKKASLKVFI